MRLNATRALPRGMCPRALPASRPSRLCRCRRATMPRRRL
jgi:hypothetical protein